MTSPFIEMVAAFARRTGVRLAPDWANALPKDLAQTDPEALATLSDAAGWPAPKLLPAKPKAQQFPLLIFCEETGWGIADQWTSEDEIRVLTLDGVKSVAWSETLLLATPSFPQATQPVAGQSALRIFLRALLGRKRLLVEATVATVVLNLIALGTSFYTMQVYDRVIPLSGFATLWVLTAGMVLAMTIDFLIRTSRSFLVDREAGEIDMQVSEFFFSRMQSVRMDARPPGIGTMAAQLRGLDQIRSTMTSASFFCLADLPFAFMFIFVMMLLGGPVALVPLIMFPLALAAGVIFAMLIRAATNKAQTSGNRKNGILVEALDASETIKANQGSWHMLAGWNRLVEDVHEHDQIVRRWSNVASATFTVMQQASYVGVVLAGVYLVTSGKMTQGGLVACTIIGGRVNGPLVSALPNLIVQWGYARSSLKALDKLLAMPSDHEPGKVPVRMSLPAPELRAEGLQFKHAGAREGLNIPSLSIPVGSRLGLIGPIGSGKSTLLRLLAGLYAPADGHILLNGVDIRQIADEDLRSACCYIAQDYRLVSGTLRDNVVLGLPDPGDEAIMAAAAETGLAQVIQEHPSGLELPISEGGGGLSGGQRTLVGLTRAILAQPRMLLLDEPTANLDAETEARVLNALLSRVPEDGILILVTHKLQLLSLVQNVIVLKNGRVAHEGTSRSVLETLRPRAAAEPGKAPRADVAISPKIPSKVS
jgi:ATP-binding cassette subfamily C protein LapB